MANKEQNNTINLGEISTIRNILMGQQMSEYNTRFDDAQEKRQILENALNEKIADLEKRTDERFQALHKEMSERFDKLEQLLLSNVNELHQKIEKITDEDRKEMSDIFAAMSQRLLKSS
jgi:predicted nuclease with TOPRIM domain